MLTQAQIHERQRRDQADDEDREGYERELTPMTDKQAKLWSIVIGALIILVCVSLMGYGFWLKDALTP